MSTIIHFGTGGWYARRDSEFTDENVIRICEGVAQVWERMSPGAIVYVGYDTREGAEQAARLASMVLAGHGLVSMLSDRYTPTPALSWAVANDNRACGGIMVTGSNRPGDYLGIKVRVEDGGTGTSDFIESIEEAIPPEATDVRGPIMLKDIVTPYLDDLVTLVDADAIAHADLQLVYDPMYGSARGYMPQVMGKLGIKTVEIHGEDEPEMASMRPEPIEPWADSCEQTVVACNAQAGLLNDGDGTRIAAVDEKGRYIDAHRLITLLMGHMVKNRGARGRVVLGLTSSMQTLRMAQALDLPVAIKPIGFKYVYEEMLKGNVMMGGEETGGISFPEHLRERDGMYALLLLCELMAKEGKGLAELVDELDARFGKVAYARRDLRLPSEDIQVLRTLLPGLNPQNISGRAPVAVSHRDGLRLEFEDGSWLLLRPSATEPLVRIYAEAQTIEMRDQMIEAGTTIARGR